jgi:hypothetical protein
LVVRTQLVRSLLTAPRTLWGISGCHTAVDLIASRQI